MGVKVKAHPLFLKKSKLDYYRNIDHFTCTDGFGRIGQSRSAVQELEYMVLADLPQEPVTISDFKQHARVDFNTDDNLIAFYLKASREYLEKWSQLSFGTKTIRMTAHRLPNRYKLMHGPYTAINDPNRTLSGAKGDILVNGGTDIDVELTSGWPNDELPEAIKVAICRYAAGLYAIRENYILNINGTIQEPSQVMDEAQKMVRPWANITFP